MLAFSPLCLAAPTRPHVALILADDLGWGNVGWHRADQTPEVQTPALDALVKDGTELNRFYAYHMCSPSRSSLQTGRHPLNVNIVNANPTIYNASESTGTGAGIPRNMSTIAAKLRSVGYNTVMAGKWDAGMATPTHTPHGRGYSSSLSYFHHGNSYWTQQTGDKTCGTLVDLYNTSQPAWGMNSTRGHIDHNNETAYEEATFHRRLLADLDAHNPAQPLFMFYAAHLVHEPYEVPQSYLDDVQSGRRAVRQLHLAGHDADDILRHGQVPRRQRRLAGCRVPREGDVGEPLAPLRLGQAPSENRTVAIFRPREILTTRLSLAVVGQFTPVAPTSPCAEANTPSSRHSIA